MAPSSTPRAYADVVLNRHVVRADGSLAGFLFETVQPHTATVIFRLEILGCSSPTELNQRYPATRVSAILRWGQRGVLVAIIATAHDVNLLRAANSHRAENSTLLARLLITGSQASGEMISLAVPGG
jgi:hypothetical protein